MTPTSYQYDRTRRSISISPTATVGMSPSPSPTPSPTLEMSASASPSVTPSFSPSPTPSMAWDEIENEENIGVEEKPNNLTDYLRNSKKTVVIVTSHHTKVKYIRDLFFNRFVRLCDTTQSMDSIYIELTHNKSRIYIFSKTGLLDRIRGLKIDLLLYTSGVDIEPLIKNGVNFLNIGKFEYEKESKEGWI